MTHDKVRLCRVSALPGDEKKYRKVLGLNDKFQLVPGERDNLQYGRYEVMEVSMRGLCKGLSAAAPKDLAFYTAGTPKATTGVIDNEFRRTAENFPFPEGPGLMVMDSDKLNKFGLNTPEDVVDVLREKLGIDADMVTSSSASSYLREDFIGEGSTGLRGLHTFVPIDKGSEAARVLEVLHRRAWLHGYGRIEVSACGSRLDRSIVDLAMQRSNQPIFEHGAILVSDGLRQEQRVEFHEGRERLLNSAAFSLSDEEEREYKRLVAAAKAALKPKADEAREQWLDAKAARFPAESRTVERARLAAQLDERLRDLAHNDTVTLNDYTEVAVGEILADPERFPHMMTLRDPFEPDYAPSRATLFREGQDDGFVKVISHAHGFVVTYRLHPDPNIKLNDTGEEVLARLREMRPEEVKAEWLEMAVDLGPIAQQAVLDAVAQVLRSQKRPLQQSLTAYRKNLARDRRNHRVAEMAGRRTRILLEPGDPVRYARQIEGLIVERAREEGHPEAFIRFADELCEVQESCLPHVHEIDDETGTGPATYNIRPLTRTAVEERIAAVAQLEKQTENGPRVVDPDPSMVTRILEIDGAAPEVLGLVPHPIVLGRGEIVSCNGLHERSHLVLVNATIEDCRPYSQPEAAEALSRLRATVLEGFEFDAPLAADSALAMLMTGVQRKALDQAPGFMVLAASQSSGKTTLARCVHVLLTGRDMAVLALPQEEAEVEKRLFAVLRTSPAMMCFDNIADGLFYRSAAIATALTNPKFKCRVLQESRTPEVPSTTLIVMTGNNLRLGTDEVTRFVTIRLAPRGPRPEERRFARTDVVAHMRQVRAQVLRDVVGIVSGYMHAGRPRQDGKGTRFAAWESQIRDPLMWAGAGDVGEVFGCNREDSEDEHARELLLRALRDRTNGAPFRTKDVVDWAVGDGFIEGDNPIRDALAARNRKFNDAHNVGAELNQLQGREIAIDDTVWTLARLKKDRAGLRRWEVRPAR